MTESAAIRLAHIRLRVYSPSEDVRYDLDTLARLADLHPALVSQYVKWGLLDPVGDAGEEGWWFDDRSLHLLRKIQRLRQELGVNLNGVGVVLELLQQIEELQRELARAAGR
jgi:DNA-binding transcriptional MerR regulator